VAVKIKLKRMGKIRAPYYRIVVADSRTKRDGRAIEEIGKYHPKADPSFIHVESERAQYWLSVGAQPTEPVRRIFEITGDWQRFRGEPGAEGTLRTAAPKVSRSERFAEAVGARPAGGETTPKGGGKAKKPEADSGKPATDKARTDKTGPDKASTDKASKADSKADKDKADKADKPARRKTAAKAEQAEQPASDEQPASGEQAEVAQPEAKAETKAETESADTEAAADSEATASDTAESGSGD
jgi:small subunit ribosomal protein S16